MLRRPKPTDSEADLLREQETFLTSGTPSSTQVLRRPDKRRGQGGGPGGGQGGPGHGEENGGIQKDVVTIEDLPDDLPSLTPAPPKKSRFKASRVTFEDEDADATLDRHDTHISAVLSRIVERDTSSTPVCLPEVTGMAFPKVLHRSATGTQQPQASGGGRRSIFARQIAAQRLAEGKSSQTGLRGKELNLHTESRMDTAHSNSTDANACAAPVGGPRLVSGRGLAGPGGAGETMRIHRENQERLQAMSQSQILAEQQKLLSQLDPRLVEFVRSRKAQSAPSSADSQRPEEAGGGSEETRHLCRDFSNGAAPTHKHTEVDMEEEQEEEEEEPSPAVMDLPLKPEKGWLHMDQLEPEKLEWIKDLPAPRRKGTKQALQARFHFNGTLIPPTEDLPTHLGLHHHGEEPERAGYSLQELFLLSRSQIIQQRSLALSTLANILTKAWDGGYGLTVRGSVTWSLLDAGLLFLLRFALDDGVEGVMSAAAQALRALLVRAQDEECLDSTFSWLGGLATFPLLSSAQEEEEEEEDEGLDPSMKLTAKEKEEAKSDHDVARMDVVKGLLRMKLLPRLRYILEVVRPAPPVVRDVLLILTRIARHSASSATQVLECPRLMETVISEFLPASWPPPAASPPQSVYGLPLAAAVKLLRVLAASGRHACARLLNSLSVRERLCCLLSAAPGELLLEADEALRLATEAYRLWAVAAGYGQACQLYIDLYPALLEALRSAHAAAPTPLQLQRALALLTLLTQVTHTAGYHQELRAGAPSSCEGEERPPPPPVSWSHVAGLPPSVLGHLKGLLKSLDDPLCRDGSLLLIPAHLLYFQAYYQQLRTQSCFKPVETLQELELLTSEVLLPLVSHTAFQQMIRNLRSSSVVCEGQTGDSDSDALPSLPGLACTGRTGPTSPLPLLTALGLLLDTITALHKGLSSKLSGVLLSEAVMLYLRGCSQATPPTSRSKAWLLRHEHQLIYLLLRLAHTLVPIDPAVAKHASLYHRVALCLLSWLLPGSEYLAQELLSNLIFSQDFISEGHSGGPEAVELGELRLQEEAGVPSSASLQTVGSLLREACAQLPSIRGCFLSQLSHLEPAARRSRDAVAARNPWVNSRLLPEAAAPTLPSDWPFLPLLGLYQRAGGGQGGGLAAEELPRGAVSGVTLCLRWLLLLEVWREDALKLIPPVAKLARLSCVFLCSSDLFLERPVQDLTWALLRLLTRRSRLDALDLNVPPPGLASFQDLYTALLAQYEAVSFGDQLFGCWILLPLQRRYTAAMRLAVFGEHVGVLRSLGVTLEQLPIPLERFTSPPEDSLPVLRLYFRALVTGGLQRRRCPVLYAAAVSHINAFIFSQDAAAQEVEAARQSMLRRIHHLSDEVLRKHLLLFRCPQQRSECGFDMYEQLPPIRAKRLQSVVGRPDAPVGGEGD